MSISFLQSLTEAASSEQQTIAADFGDVFTFFPVTGNSDTNYFAVNDTRSRPLSLSYLSPFCLSPDL